MNRRDFMRYVGSSAILAGMSGVLEGMDSGRERANVFIIFSDDLPKRDLGCYGNKVVRTPRIDRLASEGMRFENMYTTSPTCVPSRVSLFTGLYPCRNGAHPNHSRVKPGIKSVAHYMQSIGYRVILIGKKHIRPWESFPFEYYEDGGLGHVGPGPDLQRILAKPGDKPFCIILCKWGSHVPWRNYEQIYDPNTVNLPSYFIDTPQTREACTRYYSAISHTDMAVGKVLDLLDSSGLAEKTMVMFTTDHGTNWPKEKHNLYDGGINVPFVVRWPGRIKAGTVSKALCSYVDIVPTLIDMGGGNMEKVVNKCGGQMLDGKSLVPVFLGERRDHHEAVYGYYSWGVMQAYPMRAVRTARYKYIWNIDAQYRYQWPIDTGWWGEQPGPMAFTPQSAEEWRWCESWVQKAQSDTKAAEILRMLQFRPKEELYDVENDPNELHNLVGNAEHADALQKIKALLKAWMIQQGDKGDSAYHREQGRKRFLDEFYSLQNVVNVRMSPVGLSGAKVQLVSPVWAAEIRYTLDGTEPTQSSPLYTGPFEPPLPFVLKARGFYEGGQTMLKVVECDDVDYRFHYMYHFKPVSW